MSKEYPYSLIHTDQLRKDSQTLNSEIDVFHFSAALMRKLGGRSWEEQASLETVLHTAFTNPAIKAIVVIEQQPSSDNSNVRVDFGVAYSSLNYEAAKNITELFIRFIYEHNRLIDAHSKLKEILSKYGVDSSLKIIDASKPTTIENIQSQLSSELTADQTIPRILGSIVPEILKRPNPLTSKRQTNDEEHPHPESVRNGLSTLTKNYSRDKDFQLDISEK